MVEDFYKDLSAAAKVERFVLKCLEQMTQDYTFEHIGGNRAYFNKGDILATEKATGRRIFIEVKDDSCISNTRNVLCEEEVYYLNDNRLEKGNMYSDYEIYCVVAQQARKILFIDFSILKENYKQGKYKVIPHKDQTTYCYLVSIDQILDWGADIAAIDY